MFDIAWKSVITDAVLLDAVCSSETEKKAFNSNVNIYRLKASNE